MAKLNAAARNALPSSDFAVAGRKYPIENKSHAVNALARSAGKPVEAQVRAAVHSKYPNIGKSSAPAKGHNAHIHNTSMARAAGKSKA